MSILNGQWIWALVTIYYWLNKLCTKILFRYKAEQIPVAAVATGFPSGQYPLAGRLEEIKACVAAGAREIDIVINRALALENKWEELYK